MKKPWQTISTEIIQDSPWVRFKHDRFYLPSGKKGDYYYTSTYGSACIVPFLSQNQLLLTKQYRYLMKRESIEFPAGGMKKNQSPLEAAKAELKEETGYSAKKFKKIGEFNPYNGVTDEICHVFLAHDLKKFKQNLDETEELTVMIKSVSQFKKMIHTNKIWDGMTLASWVLVQRFLGD